MIVDRGLRKERRDSFMAIGCAEERGCGGAEGEGIFESNTSSI
jgi:hypothetical protein